MVYLERFSSHRLQAGATSNLSCSFSETRTMFLSRQINARRSCNCCTGKTLSPPPPPPPPPPPVLTNTPTHPHAHTASPRPLRMTRTRNETETNFTIGGLTHQLIPLNLWYIYIERERERYIYIYIHKYNYISASHLLEDASSPSALLIRQRFLDNLWKTIPLPKQSYLFFVVIWNPSNAEKSIGKAGPVFGEERNTEREANSIIICIHGRQTLSGDRPQRRGT